MFLQSCWLVMNKLTHWPTRLMQQCCVLIRPLSLYHFVIVTMGTPRSMIAVMYLCTEGSDTIV